VLWRIQTTHAARWNESPRYKKRSKLAGSEMPSDTPPQCLPLASQLARRSWGSLCSAALERHRQGSLEGDAVGRGRRSYSSTKQAGRGTLLRHPSNNSKSRERDTLHPGPTPHPLPQARHRPPQIPQIEVAAI